MNLPIEVIRNGLIRGDFANEAQISRGVVMRLFEALGWDVWNTAKTVIPEFSIKGRRAVDYALCSPPGKPSILVEVKGMGKANARGEEQLFAYCFEQGVPLAVLTDGQSWGFYFPAGQGTYQERRFAKVDLVDDSVDDFAEKIIRYLSFENVRSGEAHRCAHDDYYAFREQGAAAANFETAWAAMLARSARHCSKLVLSRNRGIERRAP